MKASLFGSEIDLGETPEPWEDEAPVPEVAVAEVLRRRDEVIDTLTFNNYRWHRTFYGIEAERLAKVFPCADRFEAMYQEELARKAA